MKSVIKIPCEVFSRVTGYFRKVDNWNLGKQSEFEDRKEADLKGVRFDKNRHGPHQLRK